MVAGGLNGKDSRVKVLVCQRLLRRGVSYDQLDDVARLGEETVRSYFPRFNKT